MVLSLLQFMFAAGLAGTIVAYIVQRLYGIGADVMLIQHFEIIQLTLVIILLFIAFAAVSQTLRVMILAQIEYNRSTSKPRKSREFWTDDV